MNNLIMSMILLALIMANMSCRGIPPNPKTSSHSGTEAAETIDWNTDYVPGRIYELQKTVVLVRYRTQIDTDFMLLHIPDYMNSEFGAPRSIEEYERKGPKAWRIRHEETRMYNGGPTMGSFGLPVGRLVSDEFSDVGPIDMWHISNSSDPYNTGYQAQSVDPEYLRPVDE